MTEILIVFATAVSALLLIDPFYSGALIISAFAKGLGLLSGVGSLSFHIVGRWVTAPQRLAQAVREMIVDWWPLLLLCSFVLAGSSYALYAEKVKETFLGMGLGMLYLPLFAVAVGASDKPIRFIKGLAAVHLLMAATMLGFLVFTDHLFHESIFAAVPIGAYFLSARRPSVWQMAWGSVLIVACALSVKNTTFLMIATTFSACVLLWALRMVRRSERFTAVTLLYIGVLIAAVAFGGLLFAWLRYRSALPSGNVEYRLEMYRIVGQRFLDSPLWGDLFADSSVNYFTLYKVALGTQNLPTHSDILDILAQGGLIGFTLWALVVWRVLRMICSTVSVLSSQADADDLRPWRWLFVLGLVQINAIITYAVNPPLVNPVLGFWVWGLAGVMWALHRSLTRPTDAVPGKASRRATYTAWA